MENGDAPQALLDYVELPDLAVALPGARALGRAGSLQPPFQVAAKGQMLWRQGPWARCAGGRRPRGLCWLLQRGGERLGPAEGRRLAAALLADGRLAQAWGLKESLPSLYQLPRLEQAEAALGRWLQEAQASGLAPFQRTARTLKRWQRQVLNYWRYSITNALVEGKHNRIKALKRRDYGCRNEGRFVLGIVNEVHCELWSRDDGRR